MYGGSQPSNRSNHPVARPTHHMSICVEYSEEPSNTSGGRYQSVTTSLEYVLVGTDLALARPVVRNKREIRTGPKDTFGRCLNDGFHFKN